MTPRIVRQAYTPPATLQAQRGRKRPLRPPLRTMLAPRCVPSLLEFTSLLLARSPPDSCRCQLARYRASGLFCEGLVFTRSHDRRCEAQCMLAGAPGPERLSSMVGRWWTERNRAESSGAETAFPPT